VGLSNWIQSIYKHLGVERHEAPSFEELWPDANILQEDEEPKPGTPSPTEMLKKHVRRPATKSQQQRSEGIKSDTVEEVDLPDMTPVLMTAAIPAPAQDSAPACPAPDPTPAPDPSPCAPDTSSSYVDTSSSYSAPDTSSYCDTSSASVDTSSF
jgi:hypothetical protein